MAKADKRAVPAGRGVAARGRARLAVTMIAGLGLAVQAATAQAAVSIYGRGLPDEPVEYLDDEEGLAPAANPIVIFGDPFMQPGNLDEGIELPTGAVWQPALWVFGEGRTALQAQDTGDAARLGEWVSTLDLFANLRLSGTERLLVGINPLRRGTGFTGYSFEPDETRGGFSRFGATLTRLFFEGDFGEIFPDLDPADELGLDYGFAVGRQALSFQQDILVNDVVDGIGIVRNSLIAPGAANLRVTGFYGWGEISRADTVKDENAHLFGLFTEADLYDSTVALDIVFVEADDTGGDGLYFGASSVQRFGLWTNSVRLLASRSLGHVDTGAVKDGLLFFTDFSTTPLNTDDILYFTAFAALGEFTQAARDPTVGGPLTRAGILFASPLLGRFSGALSARANDVVGLSAGRQWFLVPNNREQLVIEIGARKDLAGSDTDSVALGGRYQIQFHNQAFWQLDLYGSYKENQGPGYGVRSEILFRF